MGSAHPLRKLHGGDETWVDSATVVEPCRVGLCGAWASAVWCTAIARMPRIQLLKAVLIARVIRFESNIARPSKIGQPKRRASRAGVVAVCGWYPKKGSHSHHPPDDPSGGTIRSAVLAVVGRDSSLGAIHASARQKRG
jgi:hypothetical protein